MRTIAIFVVAFALAAGGFMPALAATAPKAKAPDPRITKTQPQPKTPAPKAVGTLYRGTVKEVYSGEFMFALRIGPGKLPYGVKILPTTQIVSAAGGALAFERLSAGQRVSVRGKLIGRSVIQANRITVEG
ncbi:hypothetical protein HYW68_02390 [Candidatus Parcubacteria bacterium]|nr:hypothetical protein [Candidatus Parcubacteria bacterium]